MGHSSDACRCSGDALQPRQASSYVPRCGSYRMGLMRQRFTGDVYIPVQKQKRRPQEKTADAWIRAYSTIADAWADVSCRDRAAIRIMGRTAMLRSPTQKKTDLILLFLPWALGRPSRRKDQNWQWPITKTASWNEAVFVIYKQLICCKNRSCTHQCAILEMTVLLVECIGTCRIILSSGEFAAVVCILNIRCTYDPAVVKDDRNSSVLDICENVW